MKYKKWGAMLALWAVLIPLAGCQLAQPDVEAQAEDRLVGVLVTAEPLDLFDMDGYLEDYADQLLQGGQPSAANDQAYQGRLYAKLVDDIGQQSTSKTFVFDTVEGLRCMAVTMQGENGEDAYTSLEVDEGIVPEAHELVFREDGDCITFKGTIYICLATEYDTVMRYMNPVYQSPDGRVYATTGSGISFSGGDGGGGSVTYKIEETTTQRGDTTRQDVTTIEITIASIYQPDGVAVLEMGENHQLLANTYYAPGQLPAQITPAAGTAYLVIEDRRLGPGDTVQVERRLVQPEDTEGVSTFYRQDNGTCVQQWAQVEWPAQP